MKVRLQEQEDVILGLRRDLAGASARLSDITGKKLGVMILETLNFAENSPTQT